MPDTASATPSLSKAKVFARRLLSTVVLWGVVLLAMFSNHRTVAEYVFLLIMLGLAATGLIEFYGLVEKAGLASFKNWGIVGGVLWVAAVFFQLTGRLGDSGAPALTHEVETGFLILFVLGLCVIQIFSKKTPKGILAIATTLFGLIYVPWLLNFIQKVNYFPAIDGNGRFYVLYLIVVTKFSDTGAYAIGSLIGKHKMIPRISPGKTWEGFGGAIVVSTVASVLFARLAAGRLAGMTLPHAIILGVILSVAAVAGDLIESLFKREAGVKDSGRFFPGIGGILDLLDSLLFNAPLMYLYLRHVLTP
jgi:phosphatidate cytidylyltransferase